MINVINEKHNKGGRRIKIPPEIVQKICKLYKKGINADEIGRRLDIAASTVSRYLDKNKIPRHKKYEKISEKKSILICKLYLDGISKEEISKRLSIGATSVGRHLKKHNIKLRTIKEVFGSFDSDTEKKICFDYEYKKISCTQLAINHNCSTTKISSVLDRNKIKRHDPKRFNNLEEEEIVQRYKRGESTLQIADSLDTHSSTISGILKRHKVTLRNAVEASGGLAKEIKEIICGRYINGENSTALAKEYSIGETTLLTILDKAGIKRRTVKESLGGLSNKNEFLLMQEYIKGVNSRELAEIFNVSQSTVLAILNRNNVKKRSISEVKGGLNKKDTKEVCNLYEQGESTVQIGKKFKKPPSLINRILRRNNISRRSISEASGGQPEFIQNQICQRYINGENAVEIGDSLGIHSSTIYGYLSKKNIERRVGGGWVDTVEQAINIKKRFSDKRPCFFYIYGLNEFNEFIKPGITFDMENRIKRGDGYYGKEYLLIEFDTRHEAFFLERAVLSETQKFAICPNKLWSNDWAGCTEVRKMGSDLLIEIVDYYLEELETMDLWEFAVSYVPMTLNEQEECKKKYLMNI